MRAHEVLELCAGKTLLRNEQQIYFLTADESVMREFSVLGARIVSFKPRAWSEPNTLNWEVHVVPLLDVYMKQDIFGEITAEKTEERLLREMLRER